MPLYLTPTEHALYDTLPSRLTKAWGGEVIEETGTAWETENQLKKRADYLRKQLPPRAALAVESMFTRAGMQGLDSVQVADFPPEVLRKALLVLGAVGLTAVMNKALLGAEHADDLSAIAGLSEVRHQILLSNSLVLQA